MKKVYSLSLSLFLFFFLSISLSFFLSIFQSFFLSFNLSFFLSSLLSFLLFFFPFRIVLYFFHCFISFYLSICLSSLLSIPSTYPSLLTFSSHSPRTEEHHGVSLACRFSGSGLSSAASKTPGTPPSSRGLGGVSPNELCITILLSGNRD